MVGAGRRIDRVDGPTIEFGTIRGIRIGAMEMAGFRVRRAVEDDSDKSGPT